MGRSGIINIAVLTSSRADFGIYLPLLKALKADEDINLSLIAFGTHLSKFHGYTIEDIYRHGFEVKYKIYSMSLHDDAGSIASAYGLTALKFADFWSLHSNEFRHVFCLGDRYEMAAAVMAGVPLGIRFAHIHGGETTLGAIDNVYRHSISLASRLHFVAVQEFKERIKKLTGEDDTCFVTGALSLDNLEDIPLINKEEFYRQWFIDLDKPFVLVTIHPETIAFKSNEKYAEESLYALSAISVNRQLLITMPNADTAGSVYREMFQNLKNAYPNKVHLVESLGTQAYFTCMNYADFLIGNTSSGITEAASFKKYVINVGDRQKGRLVGENVLHVPFDKSAIVEAASRISGKLFTGKNVYKQGRASSKIVEIIKSDGSV